MRQKYSSSEHYLPQNKSLWGQEVNVTRVLCLEQGCKIVLRLPLIFPDYICVWMAIFACSLLLGSEFSVLCTPSPSSLSLLSSFLYYCVFSYFYYFQSLFPSLSQFSFTVLQSVISWSTEITGSPGSRPERAVRMTDIL